MGKESVASLPLSGAGDLRVRTVSVQGLRPSQRGGGEGDDDALGCFMLRTTSNTIRTLAARLAYFHAVSGGRLACLPLELKLRGKSTTMSYGTPIYYVDFVVRSGLMLKQAIGQARELDERRRVSGFDQAALDEAAGEGFADGAFEELEEDVPAMVEEFYPEERNELPSQAREPAGSQLKGRLAGC